MHRWLSSFFMTVVLASAAQDMRDHVQPYLARALAAGNAFVVVSAASGAPAVAPDSLASLFGPSVASQTAAGSAPFPTSLGGVGVQIVDASGKSMAAPLLYVSPGQINFVVPPGLAPGTATINIVNGTGPEVYPAAPFQCSPSHPRCSPSTATAPVSSQLPRTRLPSRPH
jgi:uncharacterized protein (TIGR03437 family)